MRNQSGHECIAHGFAQASTEKAHNNSRSSSVLANGSVPQTYGSHLHAEAYREPLLACISLQMSILIRAELVDFNLKNQPNGESYL